jgi:phosphatidylglycerol:prolipoprotein diacylglycerol transferase
MVLSNSSFFWQWGEDFGVRWYGLAYLLSFLGAAVVLRGISSRQQMGLTPERCWDLVLWSSVAVLFGSRLGYCLFYDPHLFIQFRAEFPFWGVFALDEGGLSAFGAFAAVASVIWFLAWRWGLSLPYLLDLVAVAGALHLFFLRVANFLNGELLGKPAVDSFPYAFRFPQEILGWSNQIAAKMPALVAVAPTIPQGPQTAEALTLAVATPDAAFSLLRQILTNVQQGNTATTQALMPFLTPRYPTQLVAALTEGLVLFLFLVIAWYNPRRSGVIAGLFFSWYSAARFLEEEFRDLDLSTQPLFLHRR